MSDPVLLLGGLGSIGRRYQAILKSINVPYLVYDTEQDEGFSCKGEKNINVIGFEKAIICTPTDTHMEYVHQLIHMGKTFLCEKPLSKDMEEMKDLPDYSGGFMVCNYKFITKIYGNDVSLFYDYYHSGPDGLLWDCAQILFLDPSAELHNESPMWDFRVNGHHVPYRALELSYVQMIKSFIWNKGKDCWNLHDGILMSMVVMERMKK